MKCRDIERLLGEGRPLIGAVQDHVRQCAGCRALLDALETKAEPIDDSFILAIQSRFPTSFSSVKPLPTDPRLIALTAGLFTVFTLLVGSIVGLQGLMALTAWECTIYYSCIAAFGIFFSVAAVQCVIPGAKVRVGRSLVILSSIISTALVVTLLFRTFALDHFVVLGIPCLRFGCVCAALFGILAAGLMREGYVIDLRATSLLLGCFAGFSGVAVLSLHCPIKNAAHILVWHLGVVAISALGGFAISLWLQRSRLS